MLINKEGFKEEWIGIKYTIFNLLYLYFLCGPTFYLPHKKIMRNIHTPVKNAATSPLFKKFCLGKQINFIKVTKRNPKLVKLKVLRQTAL